MARGDDPVVEMSDGNRTAFAVEIPEDDENYDQSQLGKYDPRLDLSRYVFPTLELLKFYDSGNVEVNRDELEENQQMIKQTLEDFGINIASIKATVGPTVTLYEIVPEAGVRISKIKEPGRRHRLEPFCFADPYYSSDAGQGNDRDRGSEQ